MARKIVVYDKTSRKIVAVSDYDSGAIANAAWLQNLEDEGLSYVDVDGVASDSDFARRSVDPSVGEKSVEGSVSDAKFPRYDNILLSVPASVKQGSAVRIEVSQRDADLIAVNPVGGSVDYEVCYPEGDDIHDSGSISLVAGEGYVDVSFPNLVGQGEYVKDRVLVRVIRDGNSKMSTAQFVEMTV